MSSDRISEILNFTPHLQVKDYNVMRILLSFPLMVLDSIEFVVYICYVNEGKLEKCLSDPRC